ncbi:hypothetical protein MMON44395_20665 [Mycolicibacterium monacense DSM 44395]|nr:hypothetical protein [Mycolicibacterium monacense DSM 44395]
MTFAFAAVLDFAAVEAAIYDPLFKQPAAQSVTTTISRLG